MLLSRGTARIKRMVARYIDCHLCSLLSEVDGGKATDAIKIGRPRHDRMCLGRSATGKERRDQ